MFGKKRSLKDRRMVTSISDNHTYPQACLDASNDYKLFEQFRRLPAYVEILEHVSKEQGHQLLEYIANDSDILQAIDAFRDNDRYGGAVTYHYGEVGSFSPTTLRYIKVLTDLKAHFKSLDMMELCEIDVGYGGQCRVINAYFKPAEYSLVDIKPALQLAQRYLDHFVLDSPLAYLTMNELKARPYDLVISNYSLTELARPVQEVYLERVILNSKRGYITCNEITPAEFRSYTASDLLDLIPGSVRFDEEPSTHAKNCIIVWGREDAIR